MIRLLNDEQLLDLGYRKKALEQLRSDANQARKREMKKRHEVYKDLTVKWVVQKLKDEGLKDRTLKLMTNRAANISICRKVVNKLARSYSGGVIRDTGSDVGNELVSDIAESIYLDAAQVTTDRFLKLSKNVWNATLPELTNNDLENPIYRLKQKVFSPWQYDVIERARDKRSAGCVILSDYDENSLSQLPVAGSTQLSARKAQEGYSEVYSPDESITYIWWSDSYHFTTDSKGNIVKELSPEDLRNPINRIPGVSYVEEQDECYWSTGGDDLVDGSILVNTLITDMNSIAFIQGWGQFVVTGKKIPQVLEGGPHQALVFTYDEGEPEPKVDVVSANPPLESWMRLIEQYVALLLSTNDLSPSSISMKLDSATYPSGIAMLIEKSEATNSVEDSRKKFTYGEREQFEITKAWHNSLLERGQLVEEQAAFGRIPEELTYTLRFINQREVVSEKERLENIKMRKELGINTEVELLQIDNPDMSQGDAEEKLLKIKAEKIGKAITAGAQAVEDSTESETEDEVNELSPGDEVED